ncbi:MAG: endonuclease/exonuclease/phosphatase family protein [Ignavibacteriales bacterium]|nr:endonuclease/exonuclease/phosphatase family protein [Ignavibacteriales bacterium]
MKKFNILMVLIFLVTFTINCSTKNNPGKNSNSNFYLASWNIENLFDTIDDADKIDEWFLPSSEINWTDDKLNTKLNNLAKVIEFMNSGNGPDILGLQEVEHGKLIENMLDKITIKKHYKVAHLESPDSRGIDNVLVYNSDLFSLQKSEGLTVILDDNKTTRDILHCELNYNEIPINVFVNHWPSRREGLKESEKNRIAAAEVLAKRIKELNKADNSNIIIIGDFNDMPSNISISKVLKAEKIDCDKNSKESELLNLSYDLFQKGLGSYKYKDHWNMLDQIIISSSLFDEQGIDYICESFEIIKPDFIIQKEGKYAGTPLPTFGGRKYLGGYSDHFPIGAKFSFE